MVALVLLLSLSFAGLLDASIISTVSGEDIVVARKCMDLVHPCIPKSHDCSSSLYFLTSSLYETITELLSVVDENYMDNPGTFSVFPGVTSGTLRLRSSSYRDARSIPEAARFNYILEGRERGWFASASPNEYIQFSSSIPYYFSRIITKGRADFNCWVITYKLVYSIDNINWIDYNGGEELKGNVNDEQLNENLLIPFLARSVRLRPFTWVSFYHAMRVEFYISKPVYPKVLPDNALIKTVEGGFNLVVSSFYDLFSGFDKIHLGSLGFQVPHSWCAAYDDENQWAMINAARPVSWRKIEIQGRGDDDYWVTSVRVKFSENGLNWVDYKSGQTFAASYDRNTIVPILLEPFTATAIKIIPATWNGRVCLRLEVYCQEV